MVEASAERAQPPWVRTPGRTMLKQAVEAADEAAAGSYLSIKIKTPLKPEEEAS
jgi:hypothetical protein